MEDLVVVTHPEPLRIEVRQVENEPVPQDTVALGYYYNDRLVARGVVASEALEAINTLLQAPVSVAIAASEDEQGNIEGRFCLVLPVDPEEIASDDDEGEPEEPWRASVPPPPSESQEPDRPQLALLPIGNVVRGARDRHHESVADDAREMLDNLLAGRAQDAVSKAIDDLLDSL